MITPQRAHGGRHHPRRGNLRRHGLPVEGTADTFGISVELVECIRKAVPDQGGTLDHEWAVREANGLIVRHEKSVLREFLDTRVDETEISHLEAWLGAQRH